MFLLGQTKRRQQANCDIFGIRLGGCSSSEIRLQVNVNSFFNSLSILTVIYVMNLLIIDSDEGSVQVTSERLLKRKRHDLKVIVVSLCVTSDSFI